MHRLAALFLASLFAVTTAAQSRTIEVEDTFVWPEVSDPDTQQALQGFGYEPAVFEAVGESTGRTHDAVIRFPSPHADRDSVELLWYTARDEDRQIAEAPALLVVHSLHAQYVVAQSVGQRLSERGVHVFVVLLPGYTDPPADVFGQGVPPGYLALVHGQTAVANIRRARDVVLAMPNVLAEPGVALMGVSLGGFAAANAGALDGAFSQVYLVATGADAVHILESGQEEAARVRWYLETRGMDEAARAELVMPLDPLHLAHRLDPSTTWLFSGEQDTVMTEAGVNALADTIGLDEAHHVVLPGNHMEMLLFFLTGESLDLVVQNALGN